MKRLLTIAGSDSGGGAGIQADLKTFHAHRCYGMSVLTAITAQNTLGVQGVTNLEPNFVITQLNSVVGDIGVDAVKIGMLSTAGIIHALAGRLRELQLPNLVVDPVMRAKGGDPLLAPDAQDSLIAEIVPLAYLITPNIPEAEALAEMKINSIAEMKSAAARIHAKGAANVLVKGGHRTDDAFDIFYDGQDFTEFGGRRIPSKNTHGTGCTFSAAIAANLALEFNLKDAIKKAKSFISRAIDGSFDLGRGIGPLNHFVPVSENDK